MQYLPADGLLDEVLLPVIPIAVGDVRIWRLAGDGWWVGACGAEAFVVVSLGDCGNDFDLLPKRYKIFNINHYGTSILCMSEYN